MGNKVWVAILGFAFCLFSACGLFLLYLWITHQVDNREGWGGLAMSLVTISSSYRALRQRLKYNAAYSRHLGDPHDLPPNPEG